MPPLFWTGKLTLPMQVLVNANSLLALLLGNMTNTVAMKDRVKRGYEGEFSAHVEGYDALGWDFQERSARIQLEGLDFGGLRVLDVGCGTGAVADIVLEDGAQQAICGDISWLMLVEGMSKGDGGDGRYTFCQLDAEDLPYVDNSFDAVVSGMTFGMLPDQQRVVDEMVRVVKPGGLVSIGAHGPEHYWEAIDASFRCIDKRYVLGYRIEWWPREEEEMRDLLERAQLEEVESRRVIWRNEFESGSAMYDFFMAVSAAWWYERFPSQKIGEDARKTRSYFERKGLTTITDDIVVACARKPM
jgi:ubiquinone/menaquinone biosynthesis C-methylase UbiE